MLKHNMWTPSLISFAQTDHIMMSHGLHESWQGWCQDSFRIHGQPMSANIRDSCYFLGSANVGWSWGRISDISLNKKSQRRLRACSAQGMWCHGAKWKKISTRGGKHAPQSSIFIYLMHLCPKGEFHFVIEISSHVVTQLSHQKYIAEKHVNS